MRRTLLSTFLTALALGGLAAGCASDQPAAQAPESPETTAAAMEDTTTSAPAGAGGTTTRSGGAPAADVAALCGKLKVIADADKSLTGAPEADRVARMTREWPGLAATYDEAIGMAPADLSGDLRAIKRVSEVIITGIAGKPDPNSAMLELTQTHRDEIMTGGQASIRAEAFTKDRCGFSLNNE